MLLCLKMPKLMPKQDPKSTKKSPSQKKSPRTSKSPSSKSPRSPRSPKEAPTSSKGEKMNNLRQYLVPASYPNRGVVYVQKKVKDREMNQLNQLLEDKFNIQHILETMDLSTLPDGGVKLVERLSALEEDVRMQKEKISNMVVEPEEPTIEVMENDGFKGMSWEEIQKASNQVQPRMFGKQAMTTHMAERNHILNRLGDLHASLASRPSETNRAKPPSALKTELMNHQLHALSWLQWRETQGPCGGILADDMGLGKTVTMISLILSQKESGADEDDDEDEENDEWQGKNSRQKAMKGGTLVVCPATLLQQWGNEVTKHCKSHSLTVCLHHGPSRATQASRLASYDIVVTTYNLLQKDSEKNGVLMRVQWTRVILDEAHVVRNYKSATSVAVSQVRGKRRWCLTGTPVQNKELDVFALLKFLRCTPFDDLKMWKKWIDNKTLGGQERLNIIMSCLLLRRTKQQLQAKGQLDCLPERNKHDVEITLTKDEMNVYQKVLVFSKTLFAQFLQQRANNETDYTSGIDKMHRKMVALQGAKPVKSHQILVLLLRLRQICCHCGLIASMLDDEPERDQDPGSEDLLRELDKLTLEDERSRRKSGSKNEEEEEPRGDTEEATSVSEALRSVLSVSNPVFQLKRQSSKISSVIDCLKKNVLGNKGEKAVVVSQWTSVLNLVSAELKAAGVKSCTLSGNVPVTSRPALVDSINDPRSDVRVMLLSLCAGGVGLNLCGANHLLVLDPHWNPQLETQAQDRVYRVGQTKPVHIYRFTCVNTVEQTIRKLQDAKLELAEGVLNGAKPTTGSKLTIEDLKTLFDMGQNAPVIG